MLGVHILGTIVNKNGRMLDLSGIENKLALSVKQTKLKVVKKTNFNFGPFRGATYCFILAQSHLIVHTWPENDVITFDLFTCGDRQSALEAIKNISKFTNGEIKKVNVIKL